MASELSRPKKKRRSCESGYQQDDEVQEDVLYDVRQQELISRQDGRQEHFQTRYLTLDMSKYGPNIQKMTDVELLKVFDIGIAVKESFTLTVAENSSFVKEELANQMKPIRDEMVKLPFTVKEEMVLIHDSVRESLIANKNEMSDRVNDLKEGVFKRCDTMKIKLVDEVCEVSKKVLPVDVMERRINNQVNQMETRTANRIASSHRDIVEQVNRFKEEVNRLAQELQKPSRKGAVGENIAISIFRQHLPSYTFQDVSREKGKGDIHVHSPDDRHFLIEVKNRQQNVPKCEIEKFKCDVMSCHDVNVGIMLSLNTGIAMKSKSGNFELNHDNGKYLIYVPNALTQEEVMIWSVSLANELAGLDAELNENQAKKLQKLCESFQEKVKSVKECRKKMEILKRTLQDLEEGMEPIFQIVESANKKIKAILNQPSPKPYGQAEYLSPLKRPLHRENPSPVRADRVQADDADSACASEVVPVVVKPNTVIIELE